MHLKQIIQNTKVAQMVFLPELVFPKSFNYSKLAKCFHDQQSCWTKILPREKTPEMTNS